MLQNSFSAEQWYACSFLTAKRETSYAVWISFDTELYHAGWMVSKIRALLKPWCFRSGFHLMVSKSNERMLVCKGFQSHFSDDRFDVLISRLTAWSSFATCMEIPLWSWKHRELWLKRCAECHAGSQWPWLLMKSSFHAPAQEFP